MRISPLASSSHGAVSLFLTCEASRAAFWPTEAETITFGLARRGALGLPIL